MWCFSLLMLAFWLSAISEGAPQPQTGAEGLTGQELLDSLGAPTTIAPEKDPAFCQHFDVADYCKIEDIVTQCKQLCSKGVTGVSTGTSSAHRLNWRNKDRWGFTALHEATYQDQPTVARALLEAGANIDMKSTVNSLTPVFIAARDGHTAVLKVLLEPNYRADVNLASAGGFTPVYIAAEYGQTKALELLLARGGDVNLANYEGFTPVYIAAEKGQTAAIELLLARGGDVNLASDEGFTPVYAAAEHGHTAALALLLARGGDANQATNDGSSPLTIASQAGHVAVVKALVEAGADIGYVHPSYGDTALHRAAWKNHSDLALLLLQNGADKVKKNKAGETPSDLSRAHGDGSVAQIIANY